FPERLFRIPLPNAREQSPDVRLPTRQLVEKLGLFLDGKANQCQRRAAHRAAILPRLRTARKSPDFIWKAALRTPRLPAMKTEYRTEADSMGQMQVPAAAYYGAQTARAVENFPISDLRFPRQFIRALGLIKKHAAATNTALGLLPQNISES